MATHVPAYADTAGSAANYADGAPLQPGDITMEEVIEAHKGLSDNSASLTPPQQGASPQLTNGKDQSTVSIMLMQGMKSVLQDQPGSAPQLKAPSLPAANTTGTAAPILTPPSIVKASSGVSESAAARELPETISSSTGAAAAPSGSTPGCTPHAETWVRKCSDAGYPDEFTGEIKGETRTTCPAGALQDVWLSNTCAAPEEGATAATPATEAQAPESAPASTASPPAPASAVAMPQSTAAVFSSSSQVDGSCGGSNGLATVAMPNDLCSAGEATPVTGTGPWLWSCRGLNGGMTVSCAAPVLAATAAPIETTPAPVRQAEDGQCGASDGIGTPTAPVENLCAKGVASRVSGDGPWTWACSGVNGGAAAACNGPKKADGLCGGANGSAAEAMPTSDLCTEGFASAVTGEGPWNWTCSGLNGGGAVTCSSNVKRDAVCGMAAFTGHKDSPKDSLCSVGSPSSVSGSGPWLWTCDGPGGGASVSCTADVSVSGECGAANGVAVVSVPSADDLCAKGKPSRVTGNGPWSWNCVGTQGGDTQSCTAPRGPGSPAEPIAAAAPAASMAAAKAPAASPTTEVISATASSTRTVATLCGSATELAAFEAPSRNLCRAGNASGMTGNGPWKWTCADASGHTASCSTLTPGSFPKMAAPKLAASETASKAPASSSAPAPAAAAVATKAKFVCGPAAAQGAEQAPSDELCAKGNPSAVKGRGPWTWTCGKGKQKVLCEAPKMMDAICGKANGTMRRSVPVADLCKVGYPTAIQGDGPWLWSCIGEGGGVSVSCSAASQSQARVDGACGAASSSPTQEVPTTALCDGGVASKVYGDGPWTWTCSGLNGGIASSCSAQKNMPPAPPAPGPEVNGLCGASNGAAMLSQPVEGLCDAGTVTAVSGNGPWNWNCLGQNGGMTVSCTSLLQPPAPITGVCGAATGVPTSSKPQGGLCAAGISSAVSGKGPWTWSCSGTNGGGAVACIAPTSGSGGSMPSLVTPSSEPVPAAAPTSGVGRTGLVTPHLAPTAAGEAAIPVPSGSDFPTPPTPSAIPAASPVNAGEVPAIAEPGLPQDAEALTPPPVRDTLKPSAALQTPATSDAAVPGNHFELDGDVSTLSFARGAENIDPATLPTLDKLAGILQSNPAVRITLTAYADANGASPREARRLSLTRALAVRDYLTAKGIPSSRLDVRALGANVPSGDPDRVDIKAD